MAALAVLLFAGCAAHGTGHAPVMSAGESAYRANCRSCHSLRNPRKYTDEEWQVYVQKYGAKIPLTDETSKLILRYLQGAN